MKQITIEINGVTYKANLLQSDTACEAVISSGGVWKACMRHNDGDDGFRVVESNGALIGMEDAVSDALMTAIAPPKPKSRKRKKKEEEPQEEPQEEAQEESEE